MSRWINGSDDEVWDFLHHRAVKAGDVLVVPDEDDECYEDHPIFSSIDGYIPTRTPVKTDGDNADSENADGDTTPDPPVKTDGDNTEQAS
jgi:hypothetical protein